MTSNLDRLLDQSLETAFGRDEIPRPDHKEPLPEKIGRYKIASRLGVGGLGSVYIGADPELGRDVAIKILHQRHCKDQVLLKHFREEAKISSQLQHPGIVPVHELGETDDGRMYYTMRVVAGETLQQLLDKDAERDGPRSNQSFLTILERAAQAVAFAHSHGIVHGDLTPANIMVGAFGEVQVLDWGLCRRIDRPGESTPTAGRALGTPAYMAPEQAHGAKQEVGKHTDLFGLGGILCRVLTGKPPYIGDSIYQIHERAAAGALGPAIERLETSNGEPDLIDLTKRSLDPDPTNRASDAAGFAQSITDHLHAIETRAHRFELEAAEQRAQAQAAKRARRLTTMLAASIVLAVVATSGTWLWWRSEQQHRRNKANNRAVAALTTARELGQRADSVDDLRAALDATKTAAVACSAADVDPDYARQTASLHAELTASLAAEEHDAQTRRLLAERRWHTGDDRSAAEIEADYRDSFTRCGVDIENADEQMVADSVRKHRLQMELSASLHWWALKRRRKPSPEKTPWQPLLELADRCDQDTTRTDLRRAFLDGDTDKLRTLAESADAVELEPETIDLLAQFLLAGRDRDTAIELYRRAHVRHPYDYDICHGLANELVRQDRIEHKDEILALMTTGAGLRPHDPHAQTDLALNLLEHGRTDDAQPLVKHALGLDATYARAYLCQSIIDRKSGDLPGALASIRKYAQLEQPGRKPQILLAQMLSVNGKKAEAIAVCRRAVAASNKQGRALLYLGELLSERYELAEAIEVLRDALSKSKKRRDPCFLLGRTLNMARHHEEAIKLLQEANALRPGHAPTLYHLATALVSVGRLDEAVDRLTEAEEIDSPEVPAAQIGPYLDYIERMRGWQQQLTAFHNGELAPAPAMLAPLADLALTKDLFTVSNELCELFVEQFPEREGQVANIWALASAAAAFAEGTATTDAERRRLAACSLRLSRALWQNALAKAAASDAPAMVTNQHTSVLLLAPEFEVAREPEKVDWLSDDERKAWRDFWNEIEAAAPRSK